MTGKVMQVNRDQTVDVEIRSGADLILIKCDVSRRVQRVRIGSTVIIDVSPYNDRQGRIVSEAKDVRV